MDFTENPEYSICVCDRNNSQICISVNTVYIFLKYSENSNIVKVYS